MIASNNQRVLRPRFKVKKLTGTRKVPRCMRVDGMLATVMVDEPAGNMVYFPDGHSIRVSDAELRRLGLDRSAQVIDMETGDPVTAIEDDLEALSERSVRRTNNFDQIAAIAQEMGE